MYIVRETARGIKRGGHAEPTNTTGLPPHAPRDEGDELRTGPGRRKALLRPRRLATTATSSSSSRGSPLIRRIVVIV